jgi:hypothetical protein
MPNKVTGSSDFKTRAASCCSGFLFGLPSWSAITPATFLPLGLFLTNGTR